MKNETMVSKNEWVKKSAANNTHNFAATFGFVSVLCFVFFLFKQVPDRGPEQRELNLTVLCLLIIIILIT